MTRSKQVRIAIMIAAALAASGCSVFKKGSGPKTPVLGERIPVLTSESDVEVDPATQALPFTLPAAVANDAWTQSGGNATKSMGQLALGSSLTHPSDGWQRNGAIGSPREDRRVPGTQRLRGAVAAGRPADG
jgi:outer membrane protein assembly factor BamB